MKNLIGASIIMPVAFLIGCQWGVKGLCIAWLVGFPLVFLINLMRLLPAINIRVRDLMGSMIRPALSSMLMYGSVALVRLSMPEEGYVEWRLPVMILVGALVYGGVAMTANRKDFQEVLGALKR
ncbi:hypothetical protein E4Q23_14450 [Candidatus Accumulibacter phosphatis]|uniref:Uncharacterized protein n=1 Tax=Candidatus Accumulibacter phosphatis TaxID=327160 RepID=A0ABX1U0Z8_9PROT|nr:hypothetical protein [Candidatus Accumulibacter phosphatis]